MKDYVRKRGIDYLLHFTKLENVHSILTQGIIPRATLERQHANISYNDLYRYDGHKDANCLSIGHPNYKMFYRLRQQDRTVEWVVFGIKVDVLWQKDCAFCVHNAASTSVTSIPIENRKGLVALQNMFAPISGKPTREELCLPEYCPTDPQAEVLVFDTIFPNEIIGFVVSNKTIEAEYKAIYPQYEILYHRGLYTQRKDYMYW